MKRSAILAVLIIVSASGCSTQKADPPRSAAPDFTLAAGDMTFALALARYSAGMVEEMQSGPTSSRSINFFVEAAKNDPSNYLLARKAAVGLLYRRRTDEAAELLETASSQNPTNYSLLIDLAVVYDIAQDYKAQVATFERAIKLAPTNATAYIALTRAQLAHGHMNEALTTLSRGARRGNAALMSDIALFNAAALLKGGFAEESIPWFEFVLKNSAGNNGEINLILAQIHEGQGNSKEAMRHYRSAAEAPRPMPEAFAGLAILAAKTDTDAAMRILDDAEQVLPMNELILSTAAYIGEIEDCMPDSIKLIRKFQDRFKDTPPESMYLYLGGAYESTGQLDKADAVFRTALKHYPDSHEILNYLAYMWAEKGKNLEEGEKLTRRALAMEPNNGAYLDTMAWIFYMQGRNADALAVMKKALRFLPDDPTVLEHMGDILAKDGKVDDAVTYWKKSYTAAPSNEAVKEKLNAHNAGPAEEE